MLSLQSEQAELRGDWLRTRRIWKYWYNNPSQETIFGSNKVKKQHETMKLQNKEVMYRNIKHLYYVNQLNWSGSA